MSIVVTPITPATTTGYQISPSAVEDVYAALAAIAPLGWEGDVGDREQPNSDTIVWTVTLTHSGHPTLVGYDDQWIVFDETNVSIFTSAAFIATYTTNTAMVWSATTIPPTASAEPGLTATITCPTPTSANGPWTFTCALTNTAGALTTETVSAATVQSGQVSFTATDLILGDQYTAVINCNTTYSGVSADSLATASFTATT